MVQKILPGDLPKNHQRQATGTDLERLRGVSNEQYISALSTRTSERRRPFTWRSAADSWPVVDMVGNAESDQVYVYAGGML